MEHTKSDNSENFEKFGYLKKYTNYLNGFQRRYVVCHKGILSYYRHDSDYPRHRRGHISLSHASIRENSQSFIVTSNDSLTLTFKAYNSKDHSSWVETLTNAIKVSTENEIRLAVALGKYSIREIKKKLRILKMNEEKFIKNVENQFLSTMASATDLTKIIEISYPKSPEDVITGLVAQESKTKHRQSHSISLIGNKRDSDVDQTFKNLHKSLETLQAIWDERTAAASFHSERLYGLIRALLKYLEYVGADLDIPIIDIPYYPEKQMAENESDSTEFFDARDTPDDSGSEFNVPETKKCDNKFLDPSSGLVKGISHTRSASETNICSNRKSSGKTKFRKTIPICEKKSTGLLSNMSKFLKYRGGNFSLPVSFFEPLSMLQRVTEALEYSFLLDKAATCENTHFQMCYVFAFMVSNYSTTAYRKLKPFNPLLCETYEMDRTEDLGWRSICEQISHHPPAHALHVEGNGWIFTQTAGVNVQIGVTSIDVSSQGLSEVIFTRSGIHYDWNFVRTKVSGFFSGSVSLHHTGDVYISNKSTGDICKATFIPSNSQKREVSAEVIDKDGRLRYTLSGYWDKMIEYSLASPLSNEENIITIDRKVLWTVNTLPKSAEQIYNFSEFTCSLNEPDPAVAPTDSRNRPDQRALEEGNIDRASELKHEVEEYQRGRRSEALKQFKDKNIKYEDILKPVWFEPDIMRQEPEVSFYKYKGGYWEAKKTRNWSSCPKIFS